MDSLRDWDKFFRETKGLGEPRRHDAVTAGPLTRQPESHVTRFGTSGAYTDELDAQAREDTVMLALERRLMQVTALYNNLDRAIAEAEYSLTQARLMGWGAVVEEEINERTRRYMRRGSGIAEESLTVKHQRQQHR
jgi:hypothetical protein